MMFPYVYQAMCMRQAWKHWDLLHNINPLMSAMTNSRPDIFGLIFQVKAFWEKLLRRNVYCNTYEIYPSNILWNLSRFLSYCQKYLRCRQQFPEDLFSMDGLITDVLYGCLQPSLKTLAKVVEVLSNHKNKYLGDAWGSENLLLWNKWNIDGQRQEGGRYHHRLGPTSL